MKRRSVLKLAVTAAVSGGAGCTQFVLSRQQYRLWFVRIHNGSTSEQQVDIRVLRDGEVIYEHQYDSIPSFQDDQNEESSFAAMESARLIEDEWETQTDTYSIEYKLTGRDSFEHVDIGDISEFDAENIGVDMQIHGSNPTQTTVGFNVLEFDSEEQVARFISTVTNQSDGRFV